MVVKPKITTPGAQSGTKRSRVKLSGGPSSKKPVRELTDRPAEAAIVLKIGQEETRSEQSLRKTVAGSSILKRDLAKGKTKVLSTGEREIDPMSSPKIRGDTEK